MVFVWSLYILHCIIEKVGYLQKYGEWVHPFQILPRALEIARVHAVRSSSLGAGQPPTVKPSRLTQARRQEMKWGCFFVKKWKMGAVL